MVVTEAKYSTNADSYAKKSHQGPGVWAINVLEASGLGKNDR
jgi:hypothetical protein